MRAFVAECETDARDCRRCRRCTACLLLDTRALARQAGDAVHAVNRISATWMWTELCPHERLLALQAPPCASFVCLYRSQRLQSTLFEDCLLAVQLQDRCTVAVARHTHSPCGRRPATVSPHTARGRGTTGWCCSSCLPRSHPTGMPRSRQQFPRWWQRRNECCHNSGATPCSVRTGQPASPLHVLPVALLQVHAVMLPNAATHAALSLPHFPHFALPHVCMLCCVMMMCTCTCMWRRRERRR